MELCWRGRLVEIQVSSKNLVGALTTQHYLEAHGLDPPGEEIHGHCSSYLHMVRVCNQLSLIVPLRGDAMNCSC